MSLQYPDPAPIVQPADELHATRAPAPSPEPPVPAESRFIKWVVIGPHGLRTGWSIALFLILTFILISLGFALANPLEFLFFKINIEDFSPQNSVLRETIQVLAILGAALVCARIERRRILDYNLTGPHRLRHFFVGILGGFIALSALAFSMSLGGWLHFGPVALHGSAILQYGAIWGLSFLLTGLAEEGSVRCYLQFTLTRGVNFWWASALVALMCLSGLLFTNNQGVWGIDIIAALGVIPCLLLHLRKSPSAGFWQAAWLSSTFFGFIHTGNNGETWIGIFSAAAIGFVFCVSIRVTGSAWWAIGYHASWDWAQTFFYGTADSGFQPEGHFLTTNPTGATLFSGGTDGPEGSLLVIPVIVLTLIGILLVYRSKAPGASGESASPAAQPQLS